MKVSKIFTGLVVCGALIFPGALSSSAQEMNDSISLEPEALNLTIEETNSLNYSMLASEVPFINGGRYFETYYGPTHKYAISIDRNPPYAPAIYSGTLIYNASQSSFGLHWYEGRLYLQNPL
ncbi:hypothetical protein ABFY48_18985 [Lysinibacillus pakistanensis]|uniref:hypothetical protein n=1 Tax=Lysinibacillus pakistanensis TaxID=759811 RepID=UPI003D264FB7